MIWHRRVGHQNMTLTCINVLLCFLSVPSGTRTAKWAANKSERLPEMARFCVLDLFLHPTFYVLLSVSNVKKLPVMIQVALYTTCWSCCYWHQRSHNVSKAAWAYAFVCWWVDQIAGERLHPHYQQPLESHGMWHIYMLQILNACWVCLAVVVNGCGSGHNAYHLCWCPEWWTKWGKWYPLPWYQRVQLAR